MKYILFQNLFHNRLLFLLLTFFILSCSTDNDDEIPECLHEIIADILEDPPQEPRANIQLWLFNGEESYLVNAQYFEDGQSQLITLNCENICTLGGVLAGRTDCPDWEEAEFIRTVWTDNR